MKRDFMQIDLIHQQHDWRATRKTICFQFWETLNATLNQAHLSSSSAGHKRKSWKIFIFSSLNWIFSFFGSESSWKRQQKKRAINLCAVSDWYVSKQLWKSSDFLFFSRVRPSLTTIGEALLPFVCKLGIFFCLKNASIFCFLLQLSLT